MQFGASTVPPPPTVQNQQSANIGQDYGQNVLDVVVGGSTVCGGPSMSNKFALWGNYVWRAAGGDDPNIVTVQNQSDVADFPCFSKYYGSFPLDSIPPGKVIVSATLHLTNIGHSGTRGIDTPTPVYVQAYEGSAAFDPQTISWNNAPAPIQNLGGTTVPVIPLGQTGANVISWDVTSAIVNAYRDGHPFYPILYSADQHISSGEYFVSSASSRAGQRPYLTVVYGDPVP